MTRTLTTDQFNAIINNGQWEHTQHLDIIENGLGQGVVVSVFEDITVTYRENIFWDDGDEDSLDVNTEGQSDVWVFEGVNVVENDNICTEEGREYPDIDLYAYLGLDIPGDFSDADYSQLKYDYE